jgi:hypothetical protein
MGSCSYGDLCHESYDSDNLTACRSYDYGFLLPLRR